MFRVLINNELRVTRLVTVIAGVVTFRHFLRRGFLTSRVLRYSSNTRLSAHPLLPFTSEIGFETLSIPCNIKVFIFFLILFSVFHLQPIGFWLVFRIFINEIHYNTYIQELRFWDFRNIKHFFFFFLKIA